MAISHEAIQAFLERRRPPLPNVKGMTGEECERLIERITGLRPQFVTEPRLPQLQGLALALYAKRALLFYDMRMGKTKMALDFASHLGMCGLWHGKGIIVPPSPILTDVWASQARQHSVLKLTALGSGTQMDHLVQALESDTDLIAIAWSSLQAIFTEKRMTRETKNRPSRPKLYPNYDLLDQFAEMIQLIIFDEIHTTKDPLSLRFQIGAALARDAEFRLGLTGTPWGRNPMAVWSQSFLVDGGYTLGRNYYFFEQAFGIKKINPVVGKKEYYFDKDKMPILQEKLAEVSISYKRADQGKGIYENVVEIDVRGDQRDAYKAAVERFIKLPSGDRKELASTFVRLRQIASGFVNFDDELEQRQTIFFQNNAKIEWFSDFLSSLEPDIKCVFFHEFTPTGAMLSKALDKAKIKHTWLHGATKDRAGAVADFERGSAQAIVVQAASGGMGIELASADYQLFFESPTSTITRTQAERRAQGMARGERVLLIDDLVCAPIEHRVLELVKEGKDMLSEAYRDQKNFARSLMLK